MRDRVDIYINIATLAVLAIILAGCGTQPACPAPGLYRDMGAKDAVQVAAHERRSPARAHAPGGRLRMTATVPTTIISMASWRSP